MSDGPLKGLVAGEGWGALWRLIQQLAGSAGAQAEATFCQPTDNSALRVDVSTSQYVGRITAWESGACELEAVEVSTGRNTLSSHSDVASEREFLKALETVIAVVADNSRMSQAAEQGDEADEAR